MGDTSIELWMNQHQYDALERILTECGTTVETVMQARLMEFYRQTVPELERVNINNRIEAARLADERRKAELRRFSVFRVMENGSECLFESDYGMDFMQTAWQLRKYLRGEFKTQPEDFAAVFDDAVPINAKQYDEHVTARIDGIENIIGVFGIDFDKKSFSTVDRITGPKAYAIKDVCTAVYHAYRSNCRPFRERWNLFQDHLAGKEITNPAPAMRMEM